MSGDVCRASEGQAHRLCLYRAAVNTLLGLPSIGAEESSEEDSQRPLIDGAENEDDYEPNYSIQEDRAVVQVKAISFHQACCLPGVIPVRTPWSPSTAGRVWYLQCCAGWGARCLLLSTDAVLGGCVASVSFPGSHGNPVTYRSFRQQGLGGHVQT